MSNVRLVPYTYKCGVERTMGDLDQLQSAVATRDADALRHAVASIKTRSAAPLLAKLLLADWHDSHEDIALELGLIGDPSTVDSIAKAIVIPLDYLVKWGNLGEFQRKCAFALARMGTAESHAALEALAQHPDAQLRKYAQEGLQNWPCPYQGDEYV